MDLRFQVAAGSHPGKVRERNEDTCIVGERVWAIADGMGGAAAGGMASQIAAGCVEAFDKAHRGEAFGRQQISDLLVQVNSAILGYASRHPKAAGMGTTIAGVAPVALAGLQHWLVFHVGDSRVYRWSEGNLNQETTDHSEVQLLVDQGLLAKAEARTHPQRNVLTRCLGTPQAPIPGMRVVPCQAGDRILICSDGLTAEVEDDIIERVLRTTPNSRQAVDRLISVALDNGGRDNVSVIVIEVDAETEASLEGNLEDTLPMDLGGLYGSTRS